MAKTSRCNNRRRSITATAVMISFIFATMPFIGGIAADPAYQRALLSQQIPPDKVGCPSVINYGFANRADFLTVWNSGISNGNNVSIAFTRNTITTTAWIIPGLSQETTVSTTSIMRYVGLVDDLMAQDTTTYHVDCGLSSRPNRCFLYPSNLPPTVLVSGVTTNQATLGFHTDFPANLVRVYYSTTTEIPTPFWTISANTASTGLQEDCTGSVVLSNLMENTEYFYRLEVDGILWENDPSGLRTQRFQTYPPPGTPFSFSVFADSASSVSTTTVETYVSGGLSNMDDTATKPPLLFAMQIGDFDHSGPTTLEGYRSLHQRLRSPFFQQGKRLLNHVLSQMSFWHVWDDHDYCGDDSDGTCPRKPVARQAFGEYYRGYPFAAVPPSEGIWFSFEAGDANIFVLDTRSQRDPDTDPDDTSKSMLGSSQKQWLKDGLLGSAKKWKFVVSSVTANSEARTNSIDNWRSFRTEALEMSTFLQQNGLDDGTVIMISGDLHTGGAIDNGCNNIWGIPELSVAHSNLQNGNSANLGTWSEGVTSGGSAPGFATVTVDATLNVLLEAKDANGGVLHSLRIDDDFFLARDTSNGGCALITPPSAAPTRPPFIGFCFSGHDTVMVEGKGTISMRELLVGDKVMVASPATEIPWRWLSPHSGVEASPTATKKPRFETVYGFGHYHASLQAEFLRLHYHHQHNGLVYDCGHPLEISRDHLIFVEGLPYTIPASLVKKGDRLLWHQHEESAAILCQNHSGTVEVSHIQIVKRRGVFAPLTPSGTIVVNGILASTFTTLQEDSPFLVAGKDQKLLSYQLLAHAWETPYRWLWQGSFWFFGPHWCQKESYTSEGISRRLYIPWWISQHRVIPLLEAYPYLLVSFLVVSVLSWLPIRAVLRGGISPSAHLRWINCLKAKTF